MSAQPVTITPLSTFRNESPYPFCPGCGHGPILDALNRALVRLGRDPGRVVIVSDIGCSGLSDQYFVTSAFHGLHGRSLTYASGVKLARPDLTVLVAMGDGGAGIGGAHLLNAARRNLGITLLVFNNFNFGMTGGQHSVTTPAGAFTSTTPGGNLERPLDLCATVAANGAGYVYRGTSFDRDLAERIAEALSYPGFALLDIWELCTAYFVPRNRASRRTLREILERLDFATGVLVRRDLPEYSDAYWRLHREKLGRPALEPRPLEPRFESSLGHPFRLVVAGSAGGRVRSATRLAGEAALLSGLWAAQRDDYPVTVKSGHSLAELILSPREIHYTGIERPDALLLLSPQGLGKAGRHLERMEAGGRVFAPPDLEGIDSPVPVARLGPAASGPSATHLSLICLTAALRELDLFPLEALREAARRGPASRAEKNLAAIEAGLELPISGH